MKDYPFSFEQLNQFSQSLPYRGHLDQQSQKLWDQLNINKKKYNFPAINNDVGQLINFLFQCFQPSRIFEFGSGYGHSCFWYFLNNDFIDEVILTEKREDMQQVFEAAPWPDSWKEKITYYLRDAFEVFESIDTVDFVLIDGVKADYLSFLQKIESKISQNGFVLIDNSYWRGSFLDKDICEKKKTARQIRNLHEYINESSFWSAVFIPYKDGVSLLRPSLS